MVKVPTRKFQFFLIYLMIFTVLAYTYNSWAYLQNIVREYRLKADRLQSEGKLDQAIEYYQKTIGLDKYCTAAYNGLAICYEKKGWLQRAEDEYLQTLRIDPLYPPAHYNLALFYERFGNNKKAIFHWKQRVKLGHPADPGTIKSQAKLKRYAPEELKDLEAKELAKDLVQQKEKMDWQKALGKKRYRTHEEKIQDYYLEGMQFYQNGDYRKTKESFHKMIEVLPVSN